MKIDHTRSWLQIPGETRHKSAGLQACRRTDGTQQHRLRPGAITLVLG